MRLFKQVIVGIIILALSIPLVGCVAKSEYETLQKEHTALQNQVVNLQDNLSKIKEVYPLRHFSDLSELEDWIATQPTTRVTGFPIPKSQKDIKGNFIKGKLTCERALNLQKSAARDGYIISANFVRISDKLYIGIALTVLENGDVYALSTQKDDEPTFWFNIK